MLLVLRIIVAVVGLVLTFAVPGCGSGLFNSHVKQMETTLAMAQTVVQKLGTGNSAQFSAGAQVINPGIVLEAGVVYRAEARYTGVAGQLSASGAGVLNETLTPSEKQDLFRIANNTTLNDAQRRAAVDRLIDRVGARIVDGEKAKLNAAGGDQQSPIDFSAPNPNRSLPNGNEGSR